MNGPGDIPLTTLSSTPDTRPCSLISIIPTLGMSSCRGRAEAFARRLSSKLRTLGSQTDDDATSPEDEPIINGGGSANTWMSGHDTEHTVTDLQPLRHESDSFFDFDCELESPGSPVDECEYLRLIETASNTPHNSAAESGYVCASAASSHSSTDYYDVGNGSSEASGGGAANEASSSSSGMLPPQQKQQQPAEQQQTEKQQPEQQQHITEHQQQPTEHQQEPTEYQPQSTEYQQQSTEHQQQSEQQHHHLDQHPTTTTTDLSSNANNNTTATTTSPTSSTSSTIAAATTTPPPSPQTSAILPVTEMPEYINTMPATDEATPPTGKDTEPKSLPTTGPDDATADDTVPQQHAIDEPDFGGHLPPAELSTEENARMQGDIISELQKQSDQYAASMAADSQTQTELKHTITNGHAADGDEVLQIEVSEVATTTTVATSTTQTTPTTPTTTIATAIATEAEPPKAPEETPSVDSSKEPAPKASSTLHDTTDDEDDCRPQRVRRCSSLKTGKTPPGTPGRKKIVRFADVLGLDLADVKTFLDEIPTIPKSAFEDLEILDAEPPLQLGPKSDKLLMPLFQQPGGLATFLDLVREKQVSLENAAVTDSINQTITGSVRVRNLDFNKSVHIRYTLDGWRSYADLQANYVANSCDGFSDKFSFVLFGNTLQIGQRLEFAVRFQCKGQQFWDSNYGANYCFQCLPTSTPASTNIAPIVPSHHQASFAGMLSPTAGDAWCSSFY